MVDSGTAFGGSCKRENGTCRCIASPTFQLLGRKYAMDIVCVVACHGTVRFGTIETHLPQASTSTLSARLEELVTAGILARERYDEIPPRVEYRQTDAGRELAHRLEPVAEWAAHRDGDGARSASAG